MQKCQSLTWRLDWSKKTAKLVWCAVQKHGNVILQIKN